MNLATMRKVAVALSFLVALSVFTPATVYGWSSGMLAENVEIRAFSTHDKILQAAYDRTISSGLVDKGDLPPLAVIRSYEGTAGPDGLWIRGLDPDSNHYCNPISDACPAGDETAGLYTIFLEKRENGALTQEESAKYLAYIAHYVADSASPAHGFGHKRADAQGVKDDWYDPSWDGRSYLESSHFMFELDQACSGCAVPAAVAFGIGVLLTSFLIYMRRLKIKSKGRLVLWSFLGVSLSGLVSIVVATVFAGAGTISWSTSYAPTTDYESVRERCVALANKAQHSGVWERYGRSGYDDEVQKIVEGSLLSSTVDTVSDIWISLYATDLNEDANLLESK